MEKFNYNKILTLVLLLSFFLGVNLHSFGQEDVYEIYAVEYAQHPTRISASQIAIDAIPTDSISINYVIWLLKGANGKLILVDAGFTDTVQYPRKNYVRPDVALQKINIQADEITDIVVTHPHWDHIGGIELFPNAMLWMQEDDYHYFVGGAWQANGSNQGFNKDDVYKIIRMNLEGNLTLVKGDSIEIIPGISVFIGSKHTFESQYVLVKGTAGNTIIASDNIWFYYNYDHMLSIPLTFDQEGYVNEMRRMKSLVSDEILIIPGHDPDVFTRFPKVMDGVVKIEMEKRKN
jgi:glyoxylase-like metal-dependent hydrolase (beta-lactamase superfamily II)